LPTTPGGIGLVEGGLVGLLTRMHASPGAAVAGALIYRSFTFWLLISVGWAAALRLRLAAH
jgi:uncharacterized membrane protein YbhN (UPF0104 family)